MKTETIYKEFPTPEARSKFEENLRRNGVIVRNSIITSVTSLNDGVECYVFSAKAAYPEGFLSFLARLLRLKKRPGGAD